MSFVSRLLWIGRALLVLFVMALAPPAFADPFQDEWNAGMRALGQAQYEEACRHFSRAENHSGATIKTRYQLGRCNEERGDYVSAHGYFLDAARLAEIEGNPKQAEVARKRLVDIEKKVPIIIIEVSEQNRLQGMKVTLAGNEVPIQNWGQPIAVEPGSYPLRISAPGMQTVDLQVTAPGPGQRSQVVVPALAVGGPAPVTPAPVAVPPPPAPAPDEVEKKRKNPALFWTGLSLIIGGGVAGLIGGAVYGIHGQEEPPPAAIGLWVGGLALLTTGITFMAVFGRKVPVEPEETAEPKPEEALRIEPLLGPTGAGLRVRF